MPLVKAEILWTRKCSLKCSYCSMATGERNSRTLEDWKRGLDNLIELGCRFIAIYGAEPLDDFHNLPEFVHYAEQLGISTTIITSGITKNLSEKLTHLIDYGATSLSMSYDMLATDQSIDAKMRSALFYLEMFRTVAGEQCRDVAAIATVHRENFRLIPQTIRSLSRNGIWFMFDFLHPDRGQYGSKCKNFDGIDKLLFTDKNPFELRELVNVMHEVWKLKQEGKLVHFSDSAIKMLVQTNGACVTETCNYSPWLCADENNFPALVTIDCDGSVYVCDDFKGHVDKYRYDMTDLARLWDRFAYDWSKEVIHHCPGCFWNTHISAFDIADGKENFDGYIHREESVAVRGRD